MDPLVFTTTASNVLTVVLSPTSTSANLSLAIAHQKTKDKPCLWQLECLPCQGLDGCRQKEFDLFAKHDLSLYGSKV